VPVWKSHPTFFFYNMEWRDLINGGSQNQTFPLKSSYGGNFQQYFTNATNAGQSAPTLHVPNFANLSPALQAKFTNDGLVSNGAFPNNIIPADLIDPNATVLLNAGIFPTPSETTNKFLGGADSKTNLREELVRVDHQFSDKFSIFGHWISEQINQHFATTQWSGDNSPSVGDDMKTPSYSAVIHATYAIRPTLINEAAFNYNGNRIAIGPTGLFDASKLPAPGFTFNRLFTGPNQLNRIPSINAGGGNYTSNWTPWNNTADDYQIRDDISWSKGAHQLKFGASWALFKKPQDIFANTQGGFTFGGNNFSGNSFADFLLGFANNYQEAGVKDQPQYNNVSWAAYVQDDWRATRRLTLNLGLRWDGVPHTYEANNRLSNFFPNLYNPALAATFANANGSALSPTSPGLGVSPNPILAGVPLYLNGIGIDGTTAPKGLVNNHWANFGPRIGFAYDLTGHSKTVLRGGFGMTYERIQGNDVYNAGPNSPFSTNVSVNSVLLSNPNVAVAGGTPPRNIPVVNIVGFDQNNYKSPVTYQYSLGVQQSLGARSVLSMSYVGSQGRHENFYREINQPTDPNVVIGQFAKAGFNNDYNTLVRFPGYRSIRIAANEADSNYNSLQVDLRSNIKDLTLQFGYTYSHSFDVANTSGTTGFDLSNVSNPYLGWKFDYGPSVFDRRHVAFTNFVYQVPFLRHSQNHLLSSVAGGWEISGIVTMSSGSPINVTEGGNTAASVVPNASVRPNVVGPIQYLDPRAPGNLWFSGASFAAPAPGTWGNLPYNALVGPGRDNWNLSVFKSFVISAERGYKVELRGESFNTWNHTQFGAPGAGAGFSGTACSPVTPTGQNAAALGAPCQTGQSGGNLGQLNTVFTPRVLQLGIKFVF
jgi:hypothetical protein